jgi:2-polyprenyl-3-methyl-5-hydroxy-6-metoxy-1,4-benzoquinol methylase
MDEIRAIVADLKDVIRRYQEGSGEQVDNVRTGPLAEVARLQHVESHLPIGWPTLPKGLVPKLAAYVKKIVRRLLRWYINPIVDQQNAYNAAVTRVLMALTEQQRQFERKMGAQLVQVRQSQVQDREYLDKTRHLLQETRQSLLEAEQLDEEFGMRLRRLEHWQRREGAPTANAGDESTSGVPPTPDLDYFLLGAKYRNPRQMKGFLEDYDDLFTTLAKSQQQGEGPMGPVLDVGCGRGEFVAHLDGLGLSVYGIDIDRDAVEMGQEAQRDVREADVFAHLAHMPDNTLAAITLIQVIEHFEIADLLRLFSLAFRKLAVGGFLLAETINPTCLLALSNWFLLDPSHRTPLHPQMTEFLMEQAEFERVTIRFLHPVSEGGRLLLLPTQEDGPDLQQWAARLNHNFERLNEFLYGPQDYAAIGYKVDYRDVDKANAADFRQAEKG